MKAIEYIAKGVSAAMYPLWIPTYGMVLLCSAIAQNMSLPATYWLVMVGGTLLMTGLLPLAMIGYMIRKGIIKDIYITNRQQRSQAYMCTVICYAFWWWLMQYIAEVPGWLCGIALGSTIAIALVAVINLWWKISAHLTAIGGLLGGICTYYCNLPPATCHLFYITLAIALLVMYARLYLNAHTPWQVIAGLAIGLSSTLLIPLCYV